MPARQLSSHQQMNTSSANATPIPQVNVYDVRPARTGEAFELFSDALAGGKLQFSKEHVAVGYATLHSGSKGSLIRIYDAAGTLVSVREQPAGGNRPAGIHLL